MQDLPQLRSTQRLAAGLTTAGGRYAQGGPPLKAVSELEGGRGATICSCPCRGSRALAMNCSLSVG